MDTPTHEFRDLFDQLGLPSDEAEIRKFCEQHKLKDGVILPDAKFWTTSQAQFLRENWHLDADWAVLIDRLNASLRT